MHSAQPDTVRSADHHWTWRPPRAFGTMSADEYLALRLNPIREWYDKRATEAKNRFLWMRSATVIGGAIVPVMINVPWAGSVHVTTAISLAVVILLSLESVFHYREQWKNYRSTEQSLEKEYFNFVAAEGPYKGMDAPMALLELVDRVEGAIASENASTLNVMTTVAEQKPDRPGHGAGAPAAIPGVPGP